MKRLNHRIVSLMTHRDIPAQYRDQVQEIHLNTWTRHGFFMIPVGFIVALALFFQSDRFISNVKIKISFVFIFFIYVLLFLFCIFWNKSDNKEKFIKNYFLYLCYMRLFLGIFWSIFINIMIYSSNGPQVILLFGVEIGLISSAVIGGPLTYAFAFWIPIVIGSFVPVFEDARFFYFPVFLCLLSYTVYTLISIIFINNRLIERTVASLRLTQTSETIRVLLRDFEENASDWLWETDAERNLKHASARFAEVARRPAASIRGDFLAFIAGEDDTIRKVRKNTGDPYEPLRLKFEMQRPFRDIVVPANMDGEQRWWSLTGKPITDQAGVFIGYRGVGSDVTAMHQSRERIAYLARHDTLTDLANRTEFNNALGQLLADGSRSGAALLCLDLDQFKAINDSYGHGLGDSVLRAVAHRIRSAIRDRDIAARLGGDEFSIVLPSNNEFDATAVAERVIDRIARPFKFDGVTVEIGVSIGIALAPHDGETSEELYKNADLALYRAKDAGRGTWRLFDREMDRHLQERRSLQRDIKRALLSEQLFVEYQPFVALDTHKITGLESLVRWHHPERGIIAPDEFIEIAEQSGHIGTITAFVLAESLAVAAQLPANVSIAVNLSPLHLREAWLFDQLSGIIERSKIDPGRIEFEVTESAVLETEGRTLENLHRLRELGCRIAIDDFGTGYSSLATLRGFPFDRLKIDRSFIVDLERRENDAPIVKAIIELSRTLGLRVTAEGVETARHADILRAYQCHDGQGFLFSPPLPKRDVLEWFECDNTAHGMAPGQVGSAI
ncbi:EAL domain-containing protein [Acidiphilium sp. AL]|uniref:EAL domain-containing protein n=1 Tax=Acidiphilium iwatense TaxID=768198 RepID=A0ABS9DWC0_9PROT|nr:MULTISPECIES: EAL domain-containing protein [Acidiphilium]MCF3947040.1 EAL domain-containing protein [Acidiphilium iwatense]MCU4160442.1 EAL domain-containing protein [Acidiphilium sp. AL]